MKTIVKICLLSFSILFLQVSVAQPPPAPNACEITVSVLPYNTAPPYCITSAGTPFEIAYNFDPCITLVSTNVFYVQMSDNNFSTYTVVGQTAASTTTTGTITCTIPNTFAEGSYKVRVIETTPGSSCTCAGSITYPPSNAFDIHEIPVVTSFTPTNLQTGDFLCHNTTNASVLANLGPFSGSESYLWSTTANTPSTPITAPGPYAVTVTNTNNTNCFSTATFTVNQALQPLTADAGTGPVILDPDDPPTTIGGPAAGGIQLPGGPPYYYYAWTPFSFGLSSYTIEVPTLVFDDINIPTVYTVTVTDNIGCTASASITVETIKLIIDAQDVNQANYSVQYHDRITQALVPATLPSVGIYTSGSAANPPKLYIGPYYNPGIPTENYILVDITPDVSTGIQGLKMKYYYDSDWKVITAGDIPEADVNGTGNYFPLSSDYYEVTSDPREMKFRLSKPEITDIPLSIITNLLNGVKYGSDLTITIANPNGLPACPFTTQTLTIYDISHAVACQFTPGTPQWVISCAPALTPGAYFFSLLLDDGSGPRTYNGQFYKD